MPRTPMPFQTADISALARSLCGQISACGHTPGHVEMLNMLAKSAGSRNFQHFRAQHAAREWLASQVPVQEPEPKPEPEPVDFVRLRRLLRFFDAERRLLRWPPKQSQQHSCMWVLWSDLPPRRIFSEREINQFVQERHRFGDYALLRRWMCDYGMMRRAADGSRYERVEQRPPSEALALIHILRKGEEVGP